MKKYNIVSERLLKQINTLVNLDKSNLSKDDAQNVSDATSFLICMDMLFNEEQEFIMVKDNPVKEPA